jgi:SulP family sulfate permease
MTTPQTQDHAAFRRNRLNAENVIDSKSMERASSEKPDSTFSQRAQETPWLVFRSLRRMSAGALRYDLVAGLTLAAIAIPEQMATARLGGFSPQLGFFAFIAGSLAFAIFGSSRYLSSGADSTITPIFAGSLALLAATGSPRYVELAEILSLMVGVILIGAGLFRAGWIADLLSIPVTTGFLAGIAIHIIVSQALTSWLIRISWP